MSFPASSGRSWRCCVVVLVAVLGLACSSVPPPQSTRGATSVVSSKVPVVIVPGITGSKLRTTADGSLLWGEGPQILRPKDGAYALARPLSLPLDVADPDVEASAVIEEMRLFGGLVRKPIYGPVPTMLEGLGYRRGSLEAPEPGDDLFLFAYDWRGDNIVAAHALGRRLEALAEIGETGLKRMPVDLVCQSNGAHICRYLTKYGLASLEEAERGESKPVPGVEIRKVVLVGTSNGGGLRILREIDRGRTYLPVIGRKMTPEVLFSFVALFQDLPIYTQKPFIDSSGMPLDLDLFDAETWAEQGWAAFDPKVSKRMGERPDLFLDSAGRLDYLARCLDRAQRLHRVLRADLPTPPSSRYYLLQNGYLPTAYRAVVRRGEGRTELLFSGDKELDKDPYLSALAAAPGDGHATVQSQLYLSPQEMEALAAEPFLVPGQHFDLILEPATLRRLGEILTMP